MAEAIPSIPIPTTTASSDGADNCPLDPDDYDRDGWCDSVDTCILVDDPAQLDADGDGTGDACDACDGPTSGLEQFGAEVILDGGHHGANGILAEDFDGDGDPDLLVASSNEDTLTLLDNLGGGAFGPPEVLPSEVNGMYEAVGADLDGDGDLDVVAAGSLGNEVAWSRTSAERSLPR